MTTTTATDDRKPIPALPPLNWRREIPRYRIIRETKPAPKERFRLESPFSSGSESDVWQYGQRIWPAGSVIETDQWPNPGTMIPLNYAAKQVLSFFSLQMKSRMARSPFSGGKISLENGLTGSLTPNAAAPQLQPMNLRPVA
jgi:hypothetical protein